MDTNRRKDRPLAVIKRRLDRTDDGTVAKESFKSHYQHLEQLAANLRELGIDETEIDEHVTSIFHQYERALIRYLESGEEDLPRSAP